jgi:hypothetical protein
LLSESRSCSGRAFDLYSFGGSEAINLVSVD